MKTEHEVQTGVRPFSQPCDPTKPEPPANVNPVIPKKERAKRPKAEPKPVKEKSPASKKGGRPFLPDGAGRESFGIRLFRRDRQRVEDLRKELSQSEFIEKLIRDRYRAVFPEKFKQEEEEAAK